MQTLFNYFWFRAGACLFAGALISLSLAPYNIWPLSIFSLAILFFVVHHVHGKQVYYLAWLFGFGQFFSGVSWVYISIHDQSNTPAVIAVPMTFFWCASLALFCVLFALAYKFLISQNKKLTASPSIVSVFLAPTLWILCDWIRGWLMSGFPWLYIGHSQISTPLAGWVPLGGVFVLSFILALCASTLNYSVQLYVLQKKITQHSVYLLCLISSLFIGGFFLKDISWTQQKATPNLAVTLVQANVAQEEKWLPEKRDAILLRYKNALDGELKNNHLYIFPETALPDYHYNLLEFLNNVDSELKNANSHLFTGIVYADASDNKVYNSILSIGAGEQRIYHKRHLVPFGEYVPLAWLRNLADFFNLPMSNFSPGPQQEVFLHSGLNNSVIFAPFICYEIAYPNLVRKTADNADILLTISNDTWFGHSLAPHQHMQLAQFRALENGRYLIRSTNNGISAIVNQRGLIVQRLPQFEIATLNAQIPSFSGRTPYNRWGDVPMLILCALVLILVLVNKHSRK